MNRQTELLAHLLVWLWLSVPGLPAPHRAPKPVWDALKTQARLLEVTGPHEHWIADFRSEVNYVRRHWEELRFAPPLDDAVRFPPKWQTVAYRRYLDQWERCLEARRAETPWLHDEYAELQRELQQAHMLTEELRLANDPCYSWVTRRRALQRLREKLGEELYYGW
ncbi:MAG TPA: hypothetical protein VGY58_15640 [Gemmataceae bacterium]|jgi:hypothetical protein|nr:hypothetical protein [Gemmataceae bacterium]